jgi:long-chain acyl-CoA synthetase
MTTGISPGLRDRGDTWPKILKYNYEKYGDQHKAMRVKHYGIWQPYTWKDYYLDVKYLALGLLSLGFKPEDKVLIVGDNAPQWYNAELAAQSNGGAAVGLHSDLTPSEIKTIAEHSEARFAVVEGQEQIDKFLQIKDELSCLQRVIYWNYKGLAHYDDSLLLGYRELLQGGKNFEKEHPGLFERNVESGREDDICALVYTAGTTGRAPKGALHTYRTMRASVDLALHLDPWFPQDTVVPYLPPAWIREQWFGIGCHLLSACTLNFAEAPETQQRDIRETGPSIVIYGARLWESQATRIQARMLSADPIQKLTQRLFLPLGHKLADLKSRKQTPGLLLKLGYALADWTFFRPIKKSLGLSGARICYSTGAFLSPGVGRFYQALQIPLKSLYGSTEGGLLTGARSDDLRFDTVGPTHPGAEVKITDAGELLYRQPGIFVGYHKDPLQTAEVLKDGWFHSGDSVILSADGHLVFIDRLRELVELAGGGTLAPQMIEARLRFSPFIRDVWVLAGPDRSYVTAVIIINYNQVSKWAGKRRMAFTALADLSQRPEIVALIRGEINRINEELPPGVRIKKYINLHRELDPNEGEITRTGTLRRSRLETRHQGLIEALYSGQTEVVIEVPILHRDGRMGTDRTTLNIQSIEGAEQ